MTRPTFLFTQQYQRYVAWCAGVIICFSLFDILGIARLIRAQFETWLQPIQGLTARSVKTAFLPTEAVYQSWTQYRRLYDLELRYAEALAQVAEIHQLRRENEQLRSLFATASATNVSTQRRLGKIIAYGQPSIALGALDGVREQAVVLVGGVLIGRVGQVSPHQAEVILLSHTQVVPILARTESGVTGVVSGNGKQVLFQELPVEVQVNPGEEVVTVGQEGVGPGIPLGRIESIQLEKDGRTQVAVIDQLVSFYESEIVEIQ